MKANLITKDKAKDRIAEYYMRWAEMNWLISFVTTCRSLGLGKERANRLFQEIRSEMSRFNEYNDYNYSMKELTAEIERLEIPYRAGYTSSQGAYYDIHYRDRMTKKNQAAASVAQSKEAAEMLKIMKELM